jgi:hypothetical protein
VSELAVLPRRKRSKTASGATPCLGGCGRHGFYADGKCQDCKKVTCKGCGLKFSPMRSSRSSEHCHRCIVKIAKNS